jgi:thioesterase domain-containing protein
MGEQCREDKREKVADVPAVGRVDVKAVQQLDICCLNPGGSRAPIFFIRIWREVEFEGVRSLAACLGPDQPVYLVGPPAEALRHDSSVCVEDWVRHAHGLIARVAAAGPLVLGGWSFGGVIALELARELSEQGVEVSRVLMIDTWLPKKHTKEGRSVPRKSADLYDKFWSRESGDRWDVVRGPLMWRVARLRRILANAAVRFGVELGDASEAADADPIPDALRRAVWVAYLKYDARPTRQPVSIFWCASSRTSVGDVALGWGPWLRGSLECSPVPGGHFDVWKHPDAYARRIQAPLGRGGGLELRELPSFRGRRPPNPA